MGLAHGNDFLTFQNDMVSVFDAANPKCTNGSGNINDLRGDFQWTRGGTVTDTTEDGVPCFNMDTGYLETSATGLLGQNYTIYQLWKPRTTDTGWRTIYRNGDDHLGIIQDGTKNLGMYSNRNGAFRDSGYNISIAWQTWILVCTGTSATSNTGTTTHYVNGVNVGTSDRVGCGTDLYRYGWPGQGPGKISIAGMINRDLTLNEITLLHERLMLRV